MTSKFEYKKACQFCGNTFVAYTSTTKYCSNICSNRGSKAEKRQERLQIESKAIKERNRQNLLMQENLSLTDAAALLGISRPTLYNLLQTKNINNSLDKIETQDTRRQFLTIKEVQALYNTPCREPVLKAASLFSCLTGLRFSDILALKWENFETYPDGGHCIRLRTEKPMPKH
jgi:integrase